MEHQTPRTHPSFWRSSAGVATAIAGGVAAAAGVVALFSKTAAAAPVVPPAPTPLPAGAIPVTPGAYYLFQVNSASNPTTVLQAAGFSNVQAQPDPTTPDNWVVTAQWGSGATTFTPTAGWSINGSMGSPLLSTPPMPTSWAGDNGSGVQENLIVGNWYSFVVRTSFFSTTTAALAAIPIMLSEYGWDNAKVTVAADMTPVTATSGPNTWNVYAQWGGASVQAEDAPPVWILIPQKTIPGSATPAIGPIDLGSTAPASNPPNTMPW